MLEESLGGVAIHAERPRRFFDFGLLVQSGRPAEVLGCQRRLDLDWRALRTSGQQRGDNAIAKLFRIGRAAGEAEQGARIQIIVQTEIVQLLSHHADHARQRRADRIRLLHAPLGVQPLARRRPTRCVLLSTREMP
jgi:hypothetical protein